MRKSVLFSSYILVYRNRISAFKLGLERLGWRVGFELVKIEVEWRGGVASLKGFGGGGEREVGGGWGRH